jgi:hypothetical protein
MSAWRGVVVQLSLIFSALAISLCALILAPVAGHDLLLLTVGALCTAMGNAIARARTDAGGSDGGSGFTARPPPLVTHTTTDVTTTNRRTVAAKVARDGILAALLFAAGLLVAGVGR